MDFGDYLAIDDELDDIEEEANYASSCNFIRSTIEGVDNADALSKHSSLDNYSGYSQPTGGLGWAITLADFVFGDPDYELFFTLIHEPRHVRLESHGGSGVFPDEETFHLNGCTGSS